MRVKIARGILIALLWTVYTIFTYFLSVYSRFGSVDFRVYFNSAGMLLQGQSPYQGLSNYLYPPLLAQLLMPLATYLSFEMAWIVWFMFNILLIGGTIWLLNRYIPPAQRWIVWLMPLLYWAFLESLVVGQVTIVLMALFAFAWIAIKEERPEIAGGVLALAAWLKLYPLLLIFYFVWKRNQRVAMGAAIGGVLLALVQIVISGTAPFIDMIPVLTTLSGEGQTYLASANASIFGFTTQLFMEQIIVQPLLISPALHLISRIGLTLGILGMTFYVASRKSSPVANDKPDVRFNLEYAAVLTAALLLSPTLWVSGMPPMALVYFLLWHSRPLGIAGNRLGWFCLIACILTTLYYLYIIGYNPNPPQSGLLLSFGFYIILATWVLIIYMRLHISSARSRIQLLGNVR